MELIVDSLCDIVLKSGDNAFKCHVFARLDIEHADQLEAKLAHLLHKTKKQESTGVEDTAASQQQLANESPPQTQLDTTQADTQMSRHVSDFDCLSDIDSCQLFESPVISTPTVSASSSSSSSTRSATISDFDTFLTGGDDTDSLLSAKKVSDFDSLLH